MTKPFNLIELFKLVHSMGKTHREEGASEEYMKGYRDCFWVIRRYAKDRPDFVKKNSEIDRLKQELNKALNDVANLSKQHESLKTKHQNLVNQKQDHAERIKWKEVTGKLNTANSVLRTFGVNEKVIKAMNRAITD